MKERIRRSAALVLLGLALAALIASPAGAAEPLGTGATPAFVPGEVVVKFEGAPLPRAVDLPAGVGVREAARGMRRNPRIAYASPNYVATASAWVPNDPGTRPGRSAPPGSWMRKQWNFRPCGSLCDPAARPFECPAGGACQSLGGIDAIGGWRNLIAAGRPGAAGVKVAVLDTGIAYRGFRGGRFRRSPDFAKWQFARGRDLVANDRVPLDENGHGTHIAGTIGERVNNRTALTGLAYRAKLMPVRVLNGRGRGNSADIARGIRWAVNHGADVINMSFNFGACGVAIPAVHEQLRRAHRRGVVLVASAGNFDPGFHTNRCVQMPAAPPFVIAVGGTTERACLGDYSRIGSEIDVVAPGGGYDDLGAVALGARCSPTGGGRPIFQLTYRGPSRNRFGIPGGFYGTSMAAAHVSGVAAMVIASGVAGRNPPPGRVMKRIGQTARRIGSPGNERYGWGLVDAARATDPEL